MKITYDKSVDAAYIYLISDKDNVPGWAKKTYPCEIDGSINLDFTIDGKLGGIEVLGASKKLSEETLRQAEIIG